MGHMWMSPKGLTATFTPARCKIPQPKPGNPQSPTTHESVCPGASSLANRIHGTKQATAPPRNRGHITCLINELIKEPGKHFVINNLRVTGYLTLQPKRHCSDLHISHVSIARLFTGTFCLTDIANKFDKGKFTDQNQQPPD